MSTLAFLAVGLALAAGLAWGLWLVARTLYGVLMPSPDPTSAAPGGSLAGAVPRLLDSLTARALLIGALALAMAIPLLLVQDVVRERADRYAEVLADIARTWGGRQTLAGPVLAVPLTEARTVEEVDAVTSRTVRRTVRSRRVARFLPTALDIDVALADEVRERSLFRALVYGADVELEARFDLVSPEALSDAIETVHWDEAWVAVGLTDTRAIDEVARLEGNGRPLRPAPGSRVDELGAGFHAPVPGLTEATPFALAMTMSAKGSDEFRFAPLGETTTVEVRSGWPHPSFRGDALPDEREISEAGFTALWEVPHLARNYPQAWRDDRPADLAEFTAGVSLYETVSLYSQVTRAVKYGLLFVGLTFLTLLIFELALATPLHPVQYALVGIALSTFFLVLLALSEHVGFARAYAGAATLTVSMIALYTGAVLGSVRRGLGILVLLAALYAILYSLLRLEDYALLTGTALLVAVIAVLMGVTRNLHRRAPAAAVGSAVAARSASGRASRDAPDTVGTALPARSDHP